MSFSETIFLFFLALVIFGPKKLPEIARQAGKLLNEFRRASNEFKAQIEQEVAHLEVESRKPTVLSTNPAPSGTTSRTMNALSDATSGELRSLPPPAAPSAAEDEPLFAVNAPLNAATNAPAAATVTEPTALQQKRPSNPEPAATSVASPTSQESHV